MPLAIELQDAAPKVKNKFMRPAVKDAEVTFDFGESLGDFVSTGVVSNDQFTSILDGSPIVRRYNNFTINTGHTVTPTQRCKGMYLLIEGDLTVNGTLSMSARGASGPGKFVGIELYTEKIHFHSTNIFADIDPDIPVIPASIANGGAARTTNGGRLDGIAGTTPPIGCGGGGGGGIYSTPLTHSSGAGGGATSFSGGAGGGGFTSWSSMTSKTLVTAGNGSSTGGAGGRGGLRYYSNPGSGGGAGNPGGAGIRGDDPSWGNTGGVGTGGLIILIVKGNIIFGANGKIISAGAAGGNGYCSGGGGAGGGCILLFKKPSVIVDTAKITAPGGAGGTYGTSSYKSLGGKGGNGSVNIFDLAV